MKLASIIVMKILPRFAGPICFFLIVKWQTKQTVIKLITPKGNTNQGFGLTRPIHLSKVEQV
jgi:hypothetical protein